MTRRTSRDPQVDRIRRGAAEILARWREGSERAETILAEVERTLEREPAGISDVERRRLRELALGSVRLAGRYEYLVHRLQKGQTRRPQPTVEACLWLAMHELLELDGPPFAVVDQYVRLVRESEPKATGFVNGVLRSCARQSRAEWIASIGPRADDLARHWESHPGWLVSRWRQRLGEEEMLALCVAGNRRPRLVLRSAPGTRSEVVEELLAMGATVDGEPIPGAPDAICVAGIPAPRIFARLSGRVVVQDPAAQRVAPLCVPPQGGRVLDLCAAPGGKATHLAQLLADRGEVIAADASSRRIARVGSAAAALGLTNLQTVVADGTDPPWPAASFDAVLVDAPCTGTGVLSRRHEARWRRQPADLDKMPTLQRRLLDTALGLVRPGGRVVYATCSLEIEENDAVVDAVLRGRTDVVELGVRDPALEGMIRAGRYEAWPHRHGFDGAFAAVLQKVEA